MKERWSISIPTIRRIRCRGYAFIGLDTRTIMGVHGPVSSGLSLPGSRNHVSVGGEVSDILSQIQERRFPYHSDNRQLLDCQGSVMYQSRVVSVKHPVYGNPTSYSASNTFILIKLFFCIEILLNIQYIMNHMYIFLYDTNASV